MTRKRKSTPKDRPTPGRTLSRFSWRDRMLLGIPAGIFLFLLLYFSAQLTSPMAEIWLVTASSGISILVFIISKDYMTCAISQSLGLLFALLYYAADAYKGDIPIGSLLSFKDSFHIGLVWFSGLLITVLIRLFSRGKMDSKKRRASFLQAFHLTSVVFLIAYAGLLILLFYLQRTADPDGTRSLNLIPLQGAFAIYWPHILDGEFGNGIFIQFFGNLFIFTPLGFYLSVYFKKIPGFVIILLPMVLSGAIEASQYYFNMGKSDVDDFWMNVLGYWIGFMLYWLLGWIRRRITKGEEKNIC